MQQPKNHSGAKPHGAGSFRFIVQRRIVEFQLLEAIPFSNWSASMETTANTIGRLV